jgi:large subunit ribosomal protein L29
MATAKELNELTVEDLKRRANELRETLFQDRLKLRTGTLDNPGERTQHRRDLARILTVLTQKTRNQAAAAAEKP